MKKALQITHLRARRSVSERAVVREPSRGSRERLSRRARGALRRRSRRPTSAASRACSAVASGGDTGASPGGSSDGSGTGPGMNFSVGVFGIRDEISAARCVSSNAHTASRACTISTPSRWKRAGHALRAISGPTASGHAATASPIPACGPSRPSSMLQVVAERFHQRTVPGSTMSSWSGSAGKHRRVGGGDQRLPGAGDARGEDAAAGRIELREHVVEQQQRRHACALRDQLRLREEQREHREPLLALRAEAAQLARAGDDDHVVEVRAERRRAAVEVAVESLLELRRRRRFALVAKLGRVETELAGALRERRAEQRQRLEPRRDERCPECRHLLRPRSECVTRREAAGDTAQGGVALPDRGAVLRRQLRARRREPAEDAVEVRAPGGRSALDDAEPVRSEDECRRLRAQLLGGAQRRTVQRRALARARLEHDLDLQRHRRPAAAHGDPRRRLAEADQLRVLPRPRREALRRDVERLEQVRLPDPVRPNREDEPRPQREVEPLVRPEVAERDVLGDQL